MAGWIERLRRLTGEPPTNHPSRLESGITEIVNHRAAARENYQRQQQVEEAERQARTSEIRRHSLAIRQKSNAANLLEQAKRALQPLYPSATIHEHWRTETYATYEGTPMPYGYGEGNIHATTLAWRDESQTRPVQRDDEDYYFIQLACDGHNNRLSLIYGPIYGTHPASYTPVPTTLRHFTPNEWANTEVLSEAIIVAVKNPAHVPPRDRSA